MATQKQSQPEQSAHPEAKPSPTGKRVPGSEMSKSKQTAPDARNGHDKDGNEQPTKLPAGKPG